MILLIKLLILFQISHFAADYLFQGRYMMGKFRPDWGFFLPLLAHVGVHAAFTFTITIWIVGWKTALCLAIFDAVAHFCMDRIKASQKYLGRFKALSANEFMTATPAQLYSNKIFWWALGLDQMVHHLTHYAIIWYCIGCK